MDTEDLTKGLRLRTSKRGNSKMVPRVLVDGDQSADRLSGSMASGGGLIRRISLSEDQGSDSGRKHHGHSGGSSNSNIGVTNPAFHDEDLSSYDKSSCASEVETSFIDRATDNNADDGECYDISEESHRLLSNADGGSDFDREGSNTTQDVIPYDEWKKGNAMSTRSLVAPFAQVPVGCFGPQNGNINVNDLIQSIQNEESSLSIISQVSLPFVIAGFGTVGAGMVLDIVQHWDVFRKVGEIFILVPALLGLKGNLEMTLASRLSTQANLGNMDSRKEMMKMVGGNLSLIQAQAIAVGFLSSLTAMVMGWIKNGEFNINHALLLCASSLFTASIASLVLGLIMVLVILMSRYCKINPDNVATPIAASLGDLVTLTLLSWVGNLLWLAIGKQHWLAPVIITFFLILLPLWVTICVRNKYTNDVIYTGWSPVLSAMVISSISGLILDFAVAFYHGIAVFQPVINGVGGNLVAVHASRISTTLHLKGHPGSRIRDPKLKGFLNPFKVFFGSSVHSTAARVLTFLTIPGHLIFIYTISYMNAGHTSLSLLFSAVYLTASFLQVIILIYIATWMVPMIWAGGSDPDNVAIPYLTALGDLLGTAFLAISFHILFLMGDRDADVGD